jgi:ribonuclease J
MDQNNNENSQNEQDQNKQTKPNNNRNQNRNRNRPRPNNQEVNGNVQETHNDVDGNKKEDTRPPRRNNQNRNNNNRNNNRNNNNQNAGGDKNSANPANPNNNRNRNNKGGGKNRRPRKFELKVDPELVECVEKNMTAHLARLNPHNKLDLNTKGSVRITPLGGLEEIGGNITVFETENEAICIDIGMSFPDETMHGVDILVPDFSYLHEIKHKLVAYVITHAHEDHIGAVPYLFKELQMPIYGTAFPLALIANKFDEHKMLQHKKYFRPIEKRQVIEVGNDFKLEWIHMTHSIIDSSSLAVTTEMGTIIHTGDFKFDHTPMDGLPADLHRLAHYGEQGVVALLSDSTNSYNPGVTASELTVAPAFDRLMGQHEGRILMSTFSSNIHRVQQAIAFGIKYGRKICVIGRSMERNIEIAMQYGYMKFDRKHFIDQDEVSRFEDNKVLIVTTGSQGETNSALFRMSLGEHRHVKICPTDLIILSARAIPGNEAGISKMLNFLQKAGAKVEPATSAIHVSGHAAQEEQKLMLRLVNPKFFLPIHGEYNHVFKHAETAKACGVPERNILLMDDGAQIEITPKYMRKVRSIKSGKTFIDNQNNKEVASDLVEDRQKLANDGVVSIVMQLSKAKAQLISKPRISSLGLIGHKQERAFISEIEDIIETYLTNIKEGLIENPRALENDLRQVLRKHLYRKYKRYPIIQPTIFVN